MVDYVNDLGRLLGASVKAECEKNTGVIFSGGVDSTLVAVVASRFCDLTAYVTGLKNSPDMEVARKIEDKVDFKIKFVEFNAEDVERELPKLVKVVASPDPVKVGVGVPMHYASKTAKADGLSTLLCGQGGDEFFGGYWRYMELLVKSGEKAVEEMILRDIANADIDNLNRDRAVNKANGIELRVPYLNKEFMDYAGKIPFDLKIKELKPEEKPEVACVDELDGRRFIRKYILRKLAEKEGVPKLVLDRSKKAAQYGSSSSSILEKLARRHEFKRKALQAGRNDYTRMFLESIM